MPQKGGAHGGGRSGGVADPRARGAIKDDKSACCWSLLGKSGAVGVDGGL